MKNYLVLSHAALKPQMCHIFSSPAGLLGEQMEGEEIKRMELYPRNFKIIALDWIYWFELEYRFLQLIRWGCLRMITLFIYKEIKKPLWASECILSTLIGCWASWIDPECLLTAFSHLSHFHLFTLHPGKFTQIFLPESVEFLILIPIVFILRNIFLSTDCSCHNSFCFYFILFVMDIIYSQRSDDSSKSF